MEINNVSKDAWVTHTLKIAVIVALVAGGMLYLFKQIIIPKINSLPDVQLFPLLLVLFISTIYFYTVACFSSSLEEIRLILDWTRLPFLLKMLPITSDLGLKEYVSEMEYVEDRYLSKLPVLGSMIFSGLFTLSLLYTAFIIKRDTMFYMTDELMLGYMSILLTFVGMTIFRQLTIAYIIEMISYKTYIRNAGKYKVTSIVFLIAWATLFLITPVLGLVGIKFSSPTLNVMGTLMPLLILPIYVRIGIKTCRLDIVRPFDEFYS